MNERIIYQDEDRVISSPSNCPFPDELRDAPSVNLKVTLRHGPDEEASERPRYPRASTFKVLTNSEWLPFKEILQRQGALPKPGRVESAFNGLFDRFNSLLRPPHGEK